MSGMATRRAWGSLRRQQHNAQAPLLQRREFGTSDVRLATYGFIGLGNLGFPMAKNLRAKLPPDDDLYVFDKHPQVAARFAEETATGKGRVHVAASARELAEKSEVILSSLPRAARVKTVFHSILHPPLPSITFSDPNTVERLFIDFSTIDPTSSREVATAVHSSAQGRFVDAPTSGGVQGARDGTLTFMLGAHTKHGGLIKFRVRPLLEMMGAKVLHLGGQGAGLSAKLANNYLLAVTNVATAEAMHLGRRLGLDPKNLSELINSETSGGRCWSSQVNNPVPGVVANSPAERDYEGGFGVELMRVDLKLALEEAQRVGAPLALGKRADGIYDEVEKVEPGRDLSVVYRWLDQSSRTH